MEANSEAYRGACQASKMQIFMKQAVNGCKPLTISAKNSISGVWQGFEFTIEAINYLNKSMLLDMWQSSKYLASIYAIISINCCNIVVISGTYINQ